MKNNVNKFAKVYETARNVHTALIGKWEADGKNFYDELIKKTTGVMYNSIGTVSLLLLAVAFGDRQEVFREGELQKLNETVEISMTGVLESVKNYGYAADPFVDIEDSENLFTEGRGYTDTLTWVLSMTVLARYAERKGILQFSEATRTSYMHYMGDSLKLLIDGQRKDGIWGFMSDPDSERALYFTYSVASSLGDFFDYIDGEIALVEDEGADNDTDTEAYEYLSANFGADFPEKIKLTREKLSDWLLTTAIPHLPKIADCCELNEADLLGMWPVPGELKNSEYAKYFNLYYAYQLIDMIILTGADVKYAQIVEESSAEYQKLVAVYKDILSEADYKYYFSEKGVNHAADFVLDYVEQAIHATRFRLGNATRTGDAFWTDTVSELVINWKHSDDDVMREVNAALRPKRAPITDPSLTPMALRANVQYVYYISGRSDMSLGKLYKLIMSEVMTSDDERAKKSKLVVGLWDTTSYNLAITERAVEAVVDYYDYLCRYEDSEESDNTVVVAGKSALDLAIEKKIDDYIREKGLLIASAQPVEQSSNQTEQKGDIVKDTEKQIVAYKNFIDQLAALLSDNSGNAAVKSALDSLVSLFGELQKSYQRMVLTDIAEAADLTVDSKSLLDKLAARMDELLLELIKDSEKPLLTFKFFYDRLKDRPSS